MSDEKPSGRIAASQSFTPDEAKLMKLIFDTMLRGGDTNTLRKSPVFAKLCRKANSMHTRVETLATPALAKLREAPTKGDRWALKGKATLVINFVTFDAVGYTKLLIPPGGSYYLMGGTGRIATKTQTEFFKMIDEDGWTRIKS